MWIEILFLCVRLYGMEICPDAPGSFFLRLLKDKKKIPSSHD